MRRLNSRVALICLLIPLFFVLLPSGGQEAQGKIKEKRIARLAKDAAKLFDKKDYSAALDELVETSQAATGEDRAEIAAIIANGGRLLYSKRRLEDSLAYFSSALDINEALGNKEGLAQSLSFLAIISTDRGEYPEGIELFNKALVIQQEIGDMAGEARNLSNVAVFTSYMGDYNGAIGILERALDISEKIDSDQERGRAFLNLGVINFRLRNYRKSLDYLSSAISAADSAGDKALKAEALAATGVVYRHQGSFEEALKRYKEALKLSKKLKLKDRTAVNLSVIGELYKELGSYELAAKHMERSLEMSRKNKDRVMEAVNLNYLGEVKYAEGKYSDALALYNSALAVFNELGFKDRIAREYNNIGYLEGELEDWDSSYASFDKAISIYRELGDREWVRVALYGKGKYLERRGNLAEAEKNYKEAVDVFESIRRDIAGEQEALSLFSEVNSKLYERLVSLLVKTGKKEQALHYIERSRSKRLRESLLNSGLDSFDEKTRGLIRQYDELSASETSMSYELAKERAKFLPDPEKIANLTKHLARTREEFNRVTFKLMTENPRAYNLLAVSPQTFSTLIQSGAIPRGFAIVEYFVTDAETYVFVAKRNGLSIKSVSIPKADLEQMVSDFRKIIRKSRYAATNNWRGAGEGGSKEDFSSYVLPLKTLSMRLYGYLVGPILDDISDVDTVGIVPFSVLHYLPFQALAREMPGGGLQFFLEQKNIVYMTNTNYLNVVLGRSSSTGANKIVAFGNPALNDPKLDIPHSKKEVLTIKDVFPDTRVFVESDATKANFIKTWGNNQITHLAAHGIFSEEGPQILLAPHDVGSLSTFDITGLPLIDDKKLVVLSACETALEHSSGQTAETQLASLALAFTWVGAQSVVATLWEIHDEATSTLMEEFYKGIKGGEPIYEAFRKAQIALIKRDDRYGQPFFWAPFVYFGSWM
ncbi:MAG: CHAT domain-containing protein [Candidatus Dadabacteria bacterium]|nr:CHAT domain-containing protein [Candidatus Dadabacteria bacterium]